MNLDICFTYGARTQGVIRDLISAGATCARLTFSFGKVETQLGRAREILSIGDDLGQEIKVLGELEGHKVRIGHFGTTSDAYIPVRSEEIVHFVPMERYQATSTITEIPLLKFPVGIFRRGSYVSYGENDTRFEIIDIEPECAVARCMHTSQIYSTKSLTTFGQNTSEFVFDYHNSRQLQYICSNAEFAGVIIPEVRTHSGLKEAVDRIRHMNERIEIWCRIDCDIGGDELVQILRLVDGAIVDRNRIGYSLEDRILMPRTVRRMVDCSGDSKCKLLIASQIANSRTLRDDGILSAAELSDIWTSLELGVGGFLLTEETAFHEGGAEVIRQIRALSLLLGR